MIVKEMKPFAKSIGADRHEMRKLSYGSAGAAFVNFADSIITKYTKVLNYQFPTASLVLLEQAEADRQAEHDRSRQVEVNWKLITYLVRNVHMSITQPLVWNQLRQNVRESIDRLEMTDKKQAAEMRKVYRRFQDTVREVIHGGIEARYAKETQLTVADVLKDRLEKTTGYREILKFLDNIQTDNTDIIENTGTRDMRSTYRQDEKPEVVSIFSRAFFLNLNHLINDNRLPDHREIWRISNEQSQKDHNVKMWVDRMAGMTDPEKKLEILRTLVEKYGIKQVQRSINAMSSVSFEKIKDSVKLYRNYISGITDDDNGLDAVLTDTEDAGRETGVSGVMSYSETGTDRVVPVNRISPGQSAAGIGDRGLKPQPGSENAYSISPEFIYRDYVKAQADVLDILDKAEDKITTGVLEEKITEFQQVFLQSVLEKSEDSAEDETVAPPSGDDGENPEIFSDWEINRLRLFVDRKEREAVTSEDGDTPEKALLTRIMNKLWTFACREVTSFYLDNPVKVINQKTLESINSVLSEVQFRSIDTASEKKLTSFVDGLPFEPLAESDADYIDLHTSDLTVAWETGEDQSQAVLRENPLSPQDDAEPENSIERMIRVFENGSLPERTLYYLSLERALTEPELVSQESGTRGVTDTSDQVYAGGYGQVTIPGRIPGLTDQMITPGSIPNIPMDWNRMLDEAGGEISGSNLIALGENTEEAKEPAVERQFDADLFRSIYGKIWREDEQKKAASGDFRFLLTKRKKEDLMDALSDISGGDREYLSLALDRQLEYLSGRPEWTAVSEKPEKSLKTREETVRDIIEKTINTQVDDTVFRKIYERIWTEDDKKSEIGEAIIPLLATGGKTQFVDMLSDISGQRREDLTVSLDRQLEYLTQSTGLTYAAGAGISGSERPATGVPADAAPKAYEDRDGKDHKKIVRSREEIIREVVGKTFKTGEEAVRDIIEKTISAPVDDKVFRKIYGKIWTKNEKEKGLEGDISSLLANRKKGKLVGILSDVSGEDRQVLSEALERHLEYLASEPKRMSSLLNANRDEKERSSSPAYDQDRAIDITDTYRYGERLLTGRNMMGTVLQAENGLFSNSPSAPVSLERLQDSIVKYRDLINAENVHLTSLRDVEEFTRPGENAFKVYPNQSSNLVLRDNTKESADSSKDITGEQVEKIVINEQRIDNMSLDLQELKTTLMYKEEEIEKMKKTVGEQEKTIKRLESAEGKKKDLSEDQRRQLMNRLKDEAIIAGMRNGV